MKEILLIISGFLFVIFLGMSFFAVIMSGTEGKYAKISGRFLVASISSLIIFIVLCLIPESCFAEEDACSVKYEVCQATFSDGTNRYAVCKNGEMVGYVYLEFSKASEVVWKMRLESDVECAMKSRIDWIEKEKKRVKWRPAWSS